MPTTTNDVLLWAVKAGVGGLGLGIVFGLIGSWRRGWRPWQ